MKNGFCIPWVLAGITLCGCTTTRQMADQEFRPPSGSYKLIVMQPEISVGLLTAGGAVEPREDWTKQARDNVIKALVAQQGKRGGETHISTTHADTGGDPAGVADLVRLHTAVGNSIKVHKYLGVM